ncbi:MAG: hypothetical protein SGI72_12050 [Planctomycetota bacterium]|nr:hypothetical protein [Planctomycetota bacterium]
MRFQAAFALAALISSSSVAAAFEAGGQVLAFASARGGTSLFEPRVQIAELTLLIAAGDALEFELLAPIACADRVGVEIVFVDGRRSSAAPVDGTLAWRHVRIPLDEYVNLATARIELVARGGSADEIAFQVDDVRITHADTDPTIVFSEALSSGARVMRDDRRRSGVALVDSAVGFVGARNVIDTNDIREPWLAYDLANLRRGADGELAGASPVGSLLVGPCVPMRFAHRDERESLACAGQKFVFEPLEGGRFYTVWFALSTTDGEPLSTRYFAYGDTGERRAVGLVVPKRGDEEGRSTNLQTCHLVSSTVASLVPLRGIELPNDPRLRVHAITFQWHKDGASDGRFHAAWLRDQATAVSGLARDRADALLRWADNREIGPSFLDDVVDPEAEREMFTTLLRGPSPEFDKLLSRATQRQIAIGQAQKRLHIAVEDVRDDRRVVRIDSGCEPEAMLHAFASEPGSGAFILEGDPAILRQAPQIMSGLGRTAALLPSGPRIARWTASDDSSVLVLSPFRVMTDAREFADLPWRQWSKAVSLNIATPELMLAVDGSSRARRDAARIVQRLSALACVPNVRLATAEDFVAAASSRLGAALPTYAPGAMAPVQTAVERSVAARAPSVRRASNAVAVLSMLATPARMDGSDYPTAAIDALRSEVRSLSQDASRADVERIVERAESALARELDILARGAATLGKGNPFVAFNALPWSRRALVELESDSGLLYGADGAPLAWQTTARRSRVFALDVPALGYHVVRGLSGSQPVKIENKDRVSVAGFTARNDRIAFTIDPQSGALTSLMLVEKKLELLASPARLAGDDWKVEVAEFVEKGPLRAVARLVLVDGARRAELEFVLETRAVALSITARSVGDAVALQIPSRHALPRALFGVPFGSTTATPLADGRAARHRIADWAASTDGMEGIGLLAGDLATVLVEAHAITPELTSTETTRFALVPFAGGWRKAALAERACEFATKLALIATDTHEGARSPRHSFLNIVRFEGFARRLEGPQCGVVMTALEPTDDGSAYIVRLAETYGAPASLALEFDRPVFGAETVSLRGEVQRALRVEEKSVVLEMGANRIETVRVRLRP